MKTNKPKSLQARLQSRISKRANVISDLEWTRTWALSAGENEYFREVCQKLKVLAEDQKFEKSILANTYWR